MCSVAYATCTIKLLPAILLMLTIITILSMFNITVKVNMEKETPHVDPEVYTALISGKSITAYVSVIGNVDIGKTGVEVLKAWSFGKLKIYKVYLKNIDDLHKIMKIHGLVSVWSAGWSVKFPPLYWLNVSKYPFRRVDIDNMFHEAFGPWCGRNVTVAIIDTGIDYTHPDFYDVHNRTIIKVLVSVIYRTPDGRPIIWIPYVNGSMEDLLNFDMEMWRKYGEPAFLDINGHGTHVAGIIAGRGWASHGKYRGIAWCSKLVIIKAFTKDGTASLDACLTALEWVYNYSKVYGIKILSLSWGAPIASDGSDPLSLAVDRIVEDRGVWVFVAAGNMGNIPTTVTAPAVAKRAIAVGAWDPYHNRLAPFSSIGPTSDLRMKPDFVAAGVMVVSCRSRFVQFPPEYMVGKYYVALSGTSMAAPVVAGIAADFIEYYRYWHHRDPTLRDFIDWEKVNGKRIDFIAKDFVTGWGIPIAPHS